MVLVDYEKKEEVKAIEANIDMQSFHLKNIGSIIEDMETILRSNLDNIYVGKTKQVSLFLFPF